MKLLRQTMKKRVKSVAVIILRIKNMLIGNMRLGLMLESETDHEVIEVIEAILT